MEVLPVKIFKALADQSRLNIIHALMEKPMYVEVLAERLDLSSATISFHLKKLEEVGLVYSVKEQYYVIYHLSEELLNKSLKQFLKVEDLEVREQVEREQQYREKVIDSFFEYGKLKSIPVQQKKRRIILDEVAKKFEPGKVYSEREVNWIISEIHEDFCTLRRWMVDEGIFQREHNEYTLTGIITKEQKQ